MVSGQYNNKKIRLRNRENLMYVMEKKEFLNKGNDFVESREYYKIWLTMVVTSMGIIIDCNTITSLIPRSFENLC